MVNVGFHYMSERSWNELNHERNKDRILRPRRRLVRFGITDPDIPKLDIPKLPDWAYDGYIFAFPDEEAPAPWKKYAHWENEWDILTADILTDDIGNKLLSVRFDVLPADEAYVVDRAHFADLQWGHSGDRHEAIRRYAFSRVPASQYGGNYRMPELVIKNPIELERLAINSRFERQIARDEGQWAVIYKSSPT